MYHQKLCSPRPIFHRDLSGVSLYSKTHDGWDTRGADAVSCGVGAGVGAVQYA